MRTARLYPIAILLVLAGSVPASATSLVDVRAGAIGGFWACLRGPTCKVVEVFASPEAQAEWVKNERKVRALTVGTLALVPQVPAAGAARWKADWARYSADLVKAGYRQAELARLAAGTGLVQASDKVALALMSVEVTRNGRTKTEYLFLVLWRTANGYGVAYYEDSIRQVVEFMVRRKPA
jgi:hypothetical protein